MFVIGRERVLICKLALSLLFSVSLSSVALADYTEHELAKQFIAEISAKHGFEVTQMQGLFAQAERKQAILDAISRPAEKTKKWFEYRDIFLGQKRIDRGVAFWQAHRDTLARASAQFGVPEEIIVAIIGVETHYGRIKGSYRVIDALSTLAFDYPPRATFFRGELEHFFLLVREQKMDPLQLKGSYAGAMGYGQFIPSSHRNFAIDFDADQRIDIIDNPVDAIGSVANYFAKHGWQSGQRVLSRVRAKANHDQSIVNESHKPSLTQKEAKKRGFRVIDKKAKSKLEFVAPLMYEEKEGPVFWFGHQNFYVITRYNRSRLYARAVWELSQAIRDAYQSQLPVKKS